MESIHPALVHFPIALLITAWVVETASLIFQRPGWSRLAFLNLCLGTLAAGVAVFTGRQAMEVAKHSMEIYRVMEWHERLGYMVLALSVTLVLWRFSWRGGPGLFQRWSAWVLLSLICGLMVTGAYLGGRLVYEFGVGGSYGRII